MCPAYQSPDIAHFDLKKHPLLETFFISKDHLHTYEQRVKAGRNIVNAIRRDGIINISTKGICSPSIVQNAFSAQKAFFNSPLSAKMSCGNESSYGGYVYSGEEETAGKRDAAEIFTVTPDFPLDHPHVRNGIPCHGPVPWPSEHFQKHMTEYTDTMRSVGDMVLPLIALGLGMSEEAFDQLTEDSWGHMRVLKFRQRDSTNLKGIGSHTDYGLLVLAAQDHVGGLWVRPAREEARKENWKESSAGEYQEDDGWKFVVPEPEVLTCFPGDMLQFITKNALLSTPHKVELADQVRFALAYFHEPSFGAVIHRKDKDERIHYGEHFTNMFMRCYPQKAVTKQILERGLLENLDESIVGTYSF